MMYSIAMKANLYCYQQLISMNVNVYHKAKVYTDNYRIS